MAVAKKPTDTAAVIENAVQPALAMQETVRKMAEKGIEQVRTQYESIRQAASNATGTLETTVSTLNKGVMSFNVKALEAARANTNATFDHLNALMNVKTIAEAVELQSAHARKQFEAMSEQAKELASVAKQVATDTAEPVKAAMTPKK